MQIHKSDSSSTKVFVSTVKHNDASKEPLCDSSAFSGNNVIGDSGGQSRSTQGMQSSVPMFQPFTGQGSYYPQVFPRNGSYNGNFARGRGSRGFGFGGFEFGGNQRSSCQICGKSNHTALYCRHRQNMQFQPPPFMFSNFGRSGSQTWNGSYNGFGGQYNPQQGSLLNNSSFSDFSGSNGSPGFGYNGPPGFGYNGSSGVSGLYNHNGASTSQNFASGISQFPRSGNPSHYFPPVAHMVHQMGQSNQPVLPSAYTAVQPNVSTPNWYFDSGASSHITNDLTNLHLHQPCNTGEGVVVGNGNSVLVTYTGKGLLHTPSTQFHLNHVLHSPAITHNLLSVSEFAKDNACTLIFDSNGYVVQDNHTLKILLKGPCHQGLYLIQTSSSDVSSISGSSAFVSTSVSSASVWAPETRSS